jgi:hypothetical protein
MGGKEIRVHLTEDRGDDNDNVTDDAEEPTNKGLNLFLQFTEPHLAGEFNIFQKTDVNPPLSFVMFICFTIYFIVHLCYQRVFVRDASAYYLVGFLTGVFNVVTAAVLIILRFALLVPTSTLQSPLLKRIHKVCLDMDQSPALWVILNTTLMVSLSIGSSFVLLARVVQGPCDPDNMDWRAQQDCNNSTLTGLPTEQYVICLLTLLMIQILLKGANRKSLLVAWVIKFVIIMWCLHVAGATTQAWVCFHFSLVVGISYEVSGRENDWVDG